MHHPTPSLQVAAISSSSALNPLSSQHVSSGLGLESLSHVQKSNVVTSSGSSASSSDLPVSIETGGSSSLPLFIHSQQPFKSSGTFQSLSYSTNNSNVYGSSSCYSINSTPSNPSGTPHGCTPQQPHPSLGSPAISSTTSTIQQQRQGTSLVESVVRRQSLQNFNDEETNRDNESPMVHDGTLIPRASH